MTVSSDGPGPDGVPETWPEYLRRISGGATQAQIAARIGIGRLSVCNWLHGKTQPKAEKVISVARAFGRPPVEALLAAAYLGAEEVGGPVKVSVSLEQVLGELLGAEVLRRLTRLDSLTDSR
ncbi:MAG: helix-turn-helix domain-containing protein [Actinomycetia bacterium]|nr:helix-turn-helix domain-containing protein [Actinomycetes bacterium]